MTLINPSIGPERVQVFPVPLGTVQLPGSPTSITAFLISTTQGGAPVNSPVSLTDLNTFVTTFGGPDEVANNAYYAVEGFFNNAGTGNTAIIVNVGSSASASSYIGSASAKSGLRALDAIDDIGLVCIPGLPLAMAYLVQPALIDYTKTVRADFGATLSTSFSLLAMPAEIQAANADQAVVTALYASSSGSGPYTITFSGSPDLSHVTAGMVAVDDAMTVYLVISAVDNVGKSITVNTSPGSAFTVGANVNIKISSAVNYKNKVVNDPSMACAWYFNNLVVVDESTSATPGETVDVDPVGHVAGVIARIDANVAIGGVSHAPAGIQYAGLAGIAGLSLALSERTDAEPLRLHFINRITSFPGSGNIIFGAYTDAPMGSIADEQLIQVIRSLQFIKASLENGLRGFLWENFSPDTQSQVERAIQSFLRNNIYLFPAGLAEANQFKVLRVEATQDDLDQGILRVRVQVRPNSAVRFIEIALEFPLPTA